MILRFIISVCLFEYGNSRPSHEWKVQSVERTKRDERLTGIGYCCHSCPGADGCNVNTPSCCDCCDNWFGMNGCCDKGGHCNYCCGWDFPGCPSGSGHCCDQNGANGNCHCDPCCKDPDNKDKDCTCCNCCCCHKDDKNGGSSGGTGGKCPCCCCCCNHNLQNLQGQSTGSSSNNNYNNTYTCCGCGSNNNNNNNGGSSGSSNSNNNNNGCSSCCSCCSNSNNKGESSGSSNSNNNNNGCCCCSSNNNNGGSSSSNNNNNGCCCCSNTNGESSSSGSSNGDCCGCDNDSSNKLKDKANKVKAEKASKNVMSGKVNALTSLVEDYLASAKMTATAKKGKKVKNDKRTKDAAFYRVQPLDVALSTTKNLENTDGELSQPYSKKVEKEKQNDDEFE